MLRSETKLSFLLNIIPKIIFLSSSLCLIYSISIVYYFNFKNLSFFNFSKLPILIFIALLVTLAISKKTPKTCLFLFISASILIRLTLFLNFKSQQIDDSLWYFNESLRFLFNPNTKYLFSSKSPLTILLYSLTYYLPFPSNIINPILGTLLWFLLSFSIYKLLVWFKFKPYISTSIFCLILLWPTSIFASFFITSEVSFLIFFCLSTIFFNQYIYKSRKVYILYCGFSLGISLFFKSNALLYAFTCVFFLLIVNINNSNFKKRLLLAVIFSLGFSSAILLVNSYTILKHQNLKFNSHPHTGLLLINGTSIETAGSFNISYNNEFETLTKKIGIKYANEILIMRAMKNIVNNPKGFFTFALTEKVNHMWHSDSYWMWSYFRSALIEDNIREQIFKIPLKYAKAYNLLILIISFISSVLLIFEKDNKIKISFAFLSTHYVIMFFLHIFLEVSMRYNTMFYPMFFALIAYFFDKFSDFCLSKLFRPPALI